MSRSLSLVLRSSALACAAVLALAPVSLAADGAASIAHVETSEQGLQVLVSVPRDVQIDLGAVRVTVDGESVPSVAVPAADATAGLRRTAVLAIDTSNSMRGTRFAAARAAAVTFLDSVPDDVYVGIVTFAGKVATPLKPTLNRDEARSVVSALSLSRRTRLYDGVLAGLDLAGTSGQRTLVVLSDGADTTTTLLTDVIGQISSADVLVDTVALEQSRASEGALQELAVAGGGRVISADSAALGKAFAQEAAVLARQILVTAQLPGTSGNAEASLAVALPTDTRTLTARAFTTVREAAPAPGPVVPTLDPGWSPPGWVMYAGVLAVGLGLVSLLVLLIPSAPAPMSPAERVSTYTARLSRRPSTTAHRIDTDQALAQASNAAGVVLHRNTTLEARIMQRLETAGSNLKPGEWLLVHGTVFLGAGAFGLLLGAGSIAIGLLFLAGGAAGPWVYLGLRGSRRRKSFDASLPDTLQLMSGSLAAGLSLAQSVDTIVREGVEPIGSEFKRVMVETRLGVPLEDALEGVADRFGSKDFAWAVMAIRIQRQVGGNLAELLDNVAATMREREYMRRQVAALAAEGKLSAWVLGGLPPLFLLYLVLANRDYVMPLFTQPLGWLMLLGAATLLSLGVFWMSRLIKVEV